MIRHYVLLRYQASTPESHVAEFCRRMLDLKTSIEEVAGLEIGRDILRDERSWDIILAMRFESIEALRRYQNNPLHTEVMAFNAPYVTDVASLDYEHPQG